MFLVRSGIRETPRVYIMALCVCRRVSRVGFILQERALKYAECMFLSYIFKVRNDSSLGEHLF